MFVPLPEKVSEIQRLAGDFTQARYLRSKSTAELEHILGYREGRLRDGYWLMFLLQMPTVDQFEFRGYTHLSGGIVQGHLPQNRGGPTAEDRLREGGYNLTGTSYQREGLKQRTIKETFAVAGPHRIAKVRPIAPPDNDPNVPDYPPGLGVPQWTLKWTSPLPWIAAARIGPGEIYTGDFTA